MLNLLLLNGLILLVFMTLSFLVARQRQRLDTVDSVWGLGFVVVAWVVATQASSLHTVLIAILVSIWGLRLTWHLTKRSRRRGEDPRYQDMIKQWSGNIWLRGYFAVFILQGLLIWVISMPIMVAGNEPLGNAQWLTLAGASLWLLGFMIESAADQQLALFLRMRTGKDQVLDAGLWRYSRHPNYFGELLQWWSIAIIALQVSYGWIGIVGPLTLTILIVYVSGIPPIEKRRQANKAYQEYKKHTSVLIPLPRR